MYTTLFSRRPMYIFLGLILTFVACQKEKMRPESHPADPREELKNAWNGEWICVMDSCSPYFPDDTFSMTIAVGDLTTDLYKNLTDQVGVSWSHPELKESPWNCYVRDSSIILGITPLDYDDTRGWYEYEGMISQYQGRGTIQIDIHHYGTRVQYLGNIIKN